MARYNSDDAVGQLGCILIVAFFAIPSYVHEVYGTGMCVLSVIGEIALVALIFYLRKCYRKSHPLNKTAQLLGINAPAFYSKIVRNSRNMEELGNVEFFDIKIGGCVYRGLLPPLPFKKEKTNGTVAISLYERDQGRTYPVLSSIEKFQSKNSYYFYYETSMDFPYEVNEFKSAVTILTIPILVLRFSRKGVLNICCDVNISFPLGNVEHHTSTITYENPEDGYLDDMQEMKKAQEIAVKLAVILSRYDGNSDVEEAETIKNYISKIVNSSGENGDSKRKNDLNSAAKDAWLVDIEYDSQSYIDSLCEEAKGFYTINKFEIINLLLSVAKADGTAMKSEMDLIEYIVKKLGVDYEEYKNIRDKVIDLRMHETSKENKVEDAFKILGITDDMTLNEKKSVLNKEYRKWNALQNSSDEAVCKNAKDMIKLISKARAELTAK